MMDLFSEEDKREAAVEALCGKTIMNAWQSVAEWVKFAHPDATDEELQALDDAMTRSLRG